MTSGYSFTTLESIIASGAHDEASLGGRNFVNRDRRVSFRCVADNPPPVDDVSALLSFDGHERLETGYRNAMRTPGYLANGVFTFEDYGFFEACAQPIDIQRREAIMGEPICWGVDFADWHARTHNLSDILDRSAGYLDQVLQKLRNQTVSGSAIVLSAPGQEIYGHWILDIVPRLWTLNQAGHTTEPILFQVLPEWATYFLDIFDIDPARIRRHPANLFRVEQALVPSASKSGFRLGTASLSAALAQVMAAYKPVDIPANLVGEKIFFSRRKLAHSSRRSVVNIYAVEAEAARRGYRIVAPESLTIAQQIGLMQTARIVVGEDGSALHNIVFAPKGARLGVLNLPGRDNLWHLGLCQMLGHSAAYLDLPADPEWPLDLTRFNQLLDILEGKAPPASVEPAEIARPLPLSDATDRDDWPVPASAPVVAAAPATPVAPPPSPASDGNIIEIDAADRDRITVTTSGTGNVLKIGKTARLGSARIFLGQGAEVTIGEHCWLGNIMIHADRGARLEIGARVSTNGQVNFVMHEKANITVGSHSLLAGGVELAVSDMHSIIDVATGERLNPARDIHIGEHVWLATGVNVLKGVTIGRDTAVGMHSVVTRDLPANCVAAGAPARVVREGTNWSGQLL